MKTVVLGITGGIAAYKAADIANELTKAGIAVDAIMTENAQRFITALTIQTLTKRKVYTGMFEAYEPSEVEHISLAKRADLVLVAPATANILAKAACGIADDLLSTVLLAVPERKKIVFCPAMNSEMYAHPATKGNIEILMGYGCRFIEPREGLLACGDVGRGALEKTDIIVEKALELLR